MSELRHILDERDLGPWKLNLITSVYSEVVAESHLKDLLPLTPRLLSWES